MKYFNIYVLILFLTTSTVFAAAQPAAPVQITPAALPVTQGVEQSSAQGADVTPQKKFQVLTHIATTKPCIALTFDDGGGRNQVIQILEVLKDNNVKCTFFLLGNWMASNQDLVGRILAEGHEIANHSYTHPYFTKLDSQGIRDEIFATQDIFYNITGQSIKKYFRPPYGAYNEQVINTVKDMGYDAIILWNDDSRDWAGSPVENIVPKVLEQASKGGIVLFHLHGAYTVPALTQIIPALKDQGYQLVTISDMLAAADGIK